MIAEYLQWIYDDAMKKGENTDDGEKSAAQRPETPNLEDLEMFLNIVYRDAMERNEPKKLQRDPSQLSNLSIFLDAIYGDAMKERDVKTL